eukprot:jgi/Orpsp1_1/1178077/evm.model.c7180000063945.1
METIQEQIDSAISYSQIIASNTLKRMNNIKLNGVQDLIFIEEYQKYSKYKSFLGKEDDFKTNLKKPVLYLNPTSPNQSLFMDFNHDETEFSYSNYEKQIKEFTHLIEDDLSRRATPKKHEKNNYIENKNDKTNNDDINEIEPQKVIKVSKPIPKPTIPIAPDGYIPNSIILRVIHEWRNKHPEFIIDNFALNSINRSEFDLIRDFDKKINDINNIKNEKELVREIIEKFRERKNQKKLEEMEQMKRNNIKLQTELSSFLQFSYQQNRFLVKYFNGIMPSMHYNEDKISEEEEEEEKRKKEQEEEEARRAAEEEAKKLKNLSQYKKPGDNKGSLLLNALNKTHTGLGLSTKTITGSKNLAQNSIASKITDNNSISTVSLATRYLNDEIDIQDKTKRNSGIEIINENLEDNSDEDDNSNNDDDDDDDDDDDNGESDDDGNNHKNYDEDEDEDEDDNKLDIIDEDDENEDNGNKNESNQTINNMDNLIKKYKIEVEASKKYLYYSEDDIPEEIQKLLDTFWFPKQLIFEKDINQIKRDEFKMGEACSTENILPKIYSIFNSNDSDELTKFDIVNYLKYYNNFKMNNDNEYIPDNIINFLCDYLKTRWNEDLDEDEIS